jgi:hypothetical protein
VIVHIDFNKRRQTHLVLQKLTMAVGRTCKGKNAGEWRIPLGDGPC